MAVLASNFFFGDRERDLPTRDVRYTPKCRGVGGDHHPRIFLYERRATPGLGQAGELSSQISEKKETQPTHIKKRRIIQRFFLETRPFEVHAFYVYLSCFMTQLQMVHGGDTRDFAGAAAGPTEEGCVWGGRLEGRNIQRVGPEGEWVRRKRRTLVVG